MDVTDVTAAADAPLIVVTEMVFCPPTSPLPPCGWCSRGGDTGSDFTLIDKGDVEGGGVLLDMARWGSPLQEKTFPLRFL